MTLPLAALAHPFFLSVPLAFSASSTFVPRAASRCIRITRAHIAARCRRCTAPHTSLARSTRRSFFSPLLSSPLLSSPRSPPRALPPRAIRPTSTRRLLATRKRWTSLAGEERASATWRSFTRVLGLVLVLAQSRPHARFTLAREFPLPQSRSSPQEIPPSRRIPRIPRIRRGTKFASPGR